MIVTHSVQFQPAIAYDVMNLLLNFTFKLLHQQKIRDADAVVLAYCFALMLYIIGKSKQLNRHMLCSSNKCGIDLGLDF